MDFSQLRGHIKKVASVLREETGQIRPKQHALDALSRLIPMGIGHELRAFLLRKGGIQVGAGTILFDSLQVSGGEGLHYSNLTIGCDCVVDVGCTFECGDKITIGDKVTIGCQVLIITTTHEIGPREHRAGQLVRRPVVIESAARIGPRCVILPGTTIGANSVVEAGSVVGRDVPPNSRVCGIPARQVST